LKALDWILKQGAKALPIEKVDATTQKIRIAICRGCELYDPPRDKCTVCKCFMEIKTGAKTHFNPEKLRTEVTHCPKGRWGDLEIAAYYNLLDQK
jgi:hypothetical protein